MVALLLALAIDLALGDPPNRWHPVAWIGAALGRGRRALAGALPTHLLLGGAALVGGVAALAAAAAYALPRFVAGWPPLPLLVEAWLLACALSIRGLFAAVRRVRAALARGDLVDARRRLGADLVSRPTGALDEGQAASAAVESLAENLTDSVVAPLLLYALGGLAAAWAYRVVNTADAMLGYRDGELEYLGKAAARLDDALNWLPARVAALSIVAGAALTGASARGAWRALCRDGRRTASPNAGRTMAAMAGALGVTLAKPGHYTLGSGPWPDTAAIDRAGRVATVATALVVAFVLGSLWVGARAGVP
jgi:adenosylcobinamide-phosphate synthase